MNKIEKFILPKLYGYSFDNRFKWGELYLFQKDSCFEIMFERDSIYDGYDLFTLKIPFVFKLYIQKRKPKEISEKLDFYNTQRFQYGFSFIEGWRCLNFGFGDEGHYWDLPWSWQWHKTEILDYNFNTVWQETRNKKFKGNRQKFVCFNLDVNHFAKNKFSEIYPYKYTLKRGEIQERKAKVSVERRTWKMKWLPFIKRVNTCIDVEFDSEIGERVGSWKGGCVGCGYDMKKNETPEQTLRRMEKERKFN